MGLIFEQGLFSREYGTFLYSLGINDKAVEGEYRFNSDNSLANWYTGTFVSSGSSTDQCFAYNSKVFGSQWDEDDCTNTQKYICEKILQ